MIEGLTQGIRYSQDDQRLYFPLRYQGREARPDVGTDPTVVIYDPAGAEVKASTNLTELPGTHWWYVEIDASATDTWELGFNYRAQVDFIVETVPVQDNFLVDVVMWPFNEPLVTTEEIDRMHPAWIGKRPSDWQDWTEAIEMAHLRLSKDLRNLRDGNGNYIYPNRILDRGDVRMIAIAYTKAQIAESIRMKEETIERYDMKAVAAFENFNKLLMIEGDDSMVPDEDTILTGPTFNR